MTRERHDTLAPPDAGDLLSADERAKITSSFRLAGALMVLVTLIVAALTGLVFFLVSQAFDSLTPSIRDDLEWKALRGAVELSQTGELGLVVRDQTVLQRAARDYLNSPDVENVIGVDAEGGKVFEHGDGTAALLEAFKREPRVVHHFDDKWVAWSPAEIEGELVGRVLVAVSTERLRAGDEVRGQLLKAALAGGALALMLALGFVALYIMPVLRLTQNAFVRLEHTTHKALEAARLKAQFLANMSHEIRTPMNAVVGLAKLMLSMPLGPKVRRYAERIDSSARSLLGIINDILDFSKLEAGKYRIHPSPCEPSMLVQEVAELLAERAQSKGIDLVYRIAPNVPRVIEADPDRFRQVLVNLVGNAVKFTEQGEVYIEVRVEAHGDESASLRVEVQDSGIGIPPEMRGHIFESFSQADGSLVRKHGGTGLGLAISKQLVVLMGGEIGVDSETGKGSCFWFTMPLKVVDATSALCSQPSSLGKRALIVCDNAHTAVAIEEHVTAWGMTAVVEEGAEGAVRQLSSAPHPFDIIVVAESQQGAPGHDIVATIRAGASGHSPPIVLLAQLRADHATRSEMDAEIAAQLAQPVRMSELYETLARVLFPSNSPEKRAVAEIHTQNFSGAQVLVVDDNEMNQFVAVEQLTLFGCHVDQAYNGREAVKAVLAKEYDLVFMDCQMPVMDGYEATREIRAKESSDRPRAVIVALTAHALDGEREKVLESGMDDYLTKPVRPQTLQRTLARWIKRGTTTSQDGAHALAGAATESREPDNDNADENLESCASALLQMFLDKVPEQLELLDAALALENHEEVRAHAHKLKGSLLALTAGRLAQFAQQLQHHGETGDLSESEAVHARLLEGFYQLERRVKQELFRRSRAMKGGAHG